MYKHMHAHSIAFPWACTCACSCVTSKHARSFMLFMHGHLLCKAVPHNQPCCLAVADVAQQPLGRLAQPAQLVCVVSQNTTTRRCRHRASLFGCRLLQRPTASLSSASRCVQHALHPAGAARASHRAHCTWQAPRAPAVCAPATVQTASGRRHM